MGRAPSNKREYRCHQGAVTDRRSHRGARGKDFKESDRIRDELAAMGVVLKGFQGRHHLGGGAMSEMASGGCQCGAVRFRGSRFGRSSICHCRMCQKAFGGFLVRW